MNSYELSRKWFDWCFENPEKVNPNHHAIFFFAIEHCNRLGWKDKFGFPTQMVMDAVGIKNWRTYSKSLSELVDFGFIKMVELSKNQYSANVIAIVKNTKAQSKALDKALQKHNQKHNQSTAVIDKPLNNEHNNNEQIIIEKALSLEREFENFWNAYGKKVDASKCKKKFLSLTDLDRLKIDKTVKIYVNQTTDVKFRKNPLTWLNGECWNDIFENDIEHTVKRNPTYEEMKASGFFKPTL